MAKTAADKIVTENDLKNSLTGKALTMLKERHKEEFEQIATALFEANGLVRVRRLTKEEKERALLADMLAKYQDEAKVPDAADPRLAEG